MSTIATVYIHQHLKYYFSHSELIDIQIGKMQPLTLSKAFDILEQTNIIKRQRTIELMCACLWLESYILEGSSKTEFSINKNNVQKYIEMEGLKMSLLGLQNFINQLRQNNVGIGQQMTLKALFNLFYIGLFYLQENSSKQSQVFVELQNFLKTMEVDAFLIKLVTMTLQVSYLPVKKLTILYARVLSIQFGIPEFYKDSDLSKMANDNLLPEQYLRNYKEKNNARDVPHTNNPVLKFYAKHNVGDCPLAQSIVVGLLRSLLTICNSQAHKKLGNNSSSSGADAYRQWQITYQFLQRYPSFIKNFSQHSLALIQNYKQFNQTSNNTSPTQYQFYSHKIYTASCITVFFSFLLHSFKESKFIHFTYLYQLIADANGILVFLKFLTDKFENFKVPELYQQNDKSITFQNQVMLTVYSVLFMLFGACNNYPQKARNYLFEYNSYLIIKKIPHLFMKNRKNEQLPSKQEIQEQFGQIQKLSPAALKVRELTILCYDLLKIQIPFFSKKVKESSTNMRLIAQIYCQLPKTVQPIRRSQFDKILLKSKMKKNYTQKYVRSIEELKTIHHEYNNQYYWANDSLSQVKAKDKKEQKNLNMTKQEIESWLEENVWKYFD